MSKELEALDYLVVLAVIGNKEKHRGKVFDSEEIVFKAIKRNQPVKLLKEDGKEEYEWDEWWIPVGKCPLCNRYNPCSARYCMKCGQALERIDEGE